jgi:ferredoxin-NADP reductase
MADYPNEEHLVKILEAEFVTHNVRRFRLSKPASYPFTPGQATDIVINHPDWKAKRRPFTFTGLNKWDFLEFTIKIYTDHNGVTSQLGKLRVGDELILHDVFGAIQYKGQGVFIAGGAGVTPFIAIFRQLYQDGKLGNNKLLFSNKTAKDIILKEEFDKMLGDHFINTLTREKSPGCDSRRIDENYLREKIGDFSQYFYVCGPDPMVAGISEYLLQLGATKDNIVTEEF